MPTYKLTEENFEKEAMQCEKTVIIDFFATWCAPCRMLSPVLDEIAEEYANTVKLCKVNVDEEPFLASSFRVSSIPTVVVIKNGRVTDVAVGYRNKEDIEALL